MPGSDLLDDFDESLRRLDRAAGNDALGEEASEPTLATFPEQRRELVNRQAVHQLGGGRAVRTVHPHIERSIKTIRETPIGTVQLGRADPEIKQDARDRPSRRPSVQHNSQVVETGSHQVRPVPEGCQAHRGFGDGLLVGVESDQLVGRQGG